MMRNTPLSPDSLLTMLKEQPPSHLLILSVVVVSILGWISRGFFGALLLAPGRIVRKLELYRLLTAAWLHADLGHLSFNMLTLYFFSSKVVSVLGDTNFLILYGSTAVVAHIPTTFRYRHHMSYRSIGASGAVAGVMSAAILLHPQLQLHLLFIPVPVPGLIFGLVYLLYSAWKARLDRGNINHDAHFYGAAYGCLLTYYFEPLRVERAIDVFQKMVS